MARLSMETVRYVAFVAEGSSKYLRDIQRL